MILLQRARRGMINNVYGLASDVNTQEKSDSYFFGQAAFSNQIFLHKNNCFFIVYYIYYYGFL